MINLLVNGFIFVICAIGFLTMMLSFFGGFGGKRGFLSFLIFEKLGIFKIIFSAIKFCVYVICIYIVFCVIVSR